ncbi:MAG: hypothetical protein QF926_16480 [Alphaproteobacteria bacterium]|jgi:hypothetical protein|nr:hypothetical protein [Alphaproteobacteria bacterium]MDP6518201.1 hypothetical protein [Alphaproteobacteria bacterium]
MGPEILVPIGDRTAGLLDVDPRPMDEDVIARHPRGRRGEARVAGQIPEPAVDQMRPVDHMGGAVGPARDLRPGAPEHRLGGRFEHRDLPWLRHPGHRRVTLLPERRKRRP